MNRIKYMDGLKGLLWIPVFVGHYGGAFGYTPFWRLHSSIVGEGAFINGNFSVNVFYFISAYVLCNQVYSQLEEGTITPYKIFEKMIKRYYRFAFPLTILYLLIYGISRLGLFYSNQANVFIASDFLGSLFSSTYTLYDVFIDGLVKTLFLGEYKFNSAMWMMNTLFLGWYFSLIMSLCLFFGKKKSERYLIILALILLLIDSFYVMFVVGVLMVKFSGKTNKQGISFLGGD